jgi:hypothetical protein
MDGPDHYRKAEELLAELEDHPAISAGTEAALAVRAVTHAVLAIAAAAALGDGTLEARRWRDVAGSKLTL